MMSGVDAVAVGFGIVAHKRAYVFIAKQFIGISKKGMY